MKPEDKLRVLLKDYERAEIGGAADSEHLRDKNFIRLIENAAPNNSPNGNDDAPVAAELAPLRRHLAVCDSCLDQFNDFHAFFARAEPGETVAEKREIDAAWQMFAPRITVKETKLNFWARWFSSEKKTNYFAVFGWSFAALFLLFTGIAAFVAWQAKNENSQLVEQFERQKLSSEERLKTLEQSAQNQDLAEQEKARLAAEKGELEKRVAQLQTEIERAKQSDSTRDKIVSLPLPSNSPTEKLDNSLVAVNTPIYDVFPSDSVVRSGNQSANKLLVPNAAKNVVLILNAAGRADFPVYQAALLDGAGKIVWRGGGLRKDATGNFSLSISRSALKTGDYRLELSSAAQSVADYSINVEIGK